MPEGPSILNLRNKLKPFIGKTVTNAGGYGKMATKWIDGQKLLGIKTHGKYLFFEFKNGIVQLHLGLFGSVIINERKEVNRKFYLEFEDGEINGYITNTKKLKEIPADLNNGKNDILSGNYDEKYVLGLIKNKTAETIDDILMDQDIFAGVGNKIRNEALYRAGIHPLSVVEKIPDAKLKTLIKAVRSYAEIFYNNLVNTGKNEEFMIYKQDKDPKGNPVTEKKLRTNRKIYYSKAQKLY